MDIEVVSKNKQIVKNSIFLLSRTVFLTLVTLYTLREVISILGAEKFGLYTVVFGIVAMFAFVNSAMMSATQRFLSIAIGKSQIQEIRGNFYCALFVHGVLAFFLSFLIYFLKDFLINQFLNINGYKKEAEIIYYLAIVSIFISLIQVPFSALITSYEKMQAFAYLAVFEGLAKLGVVYLLVFFDYSKVILYSLFLTITSFFIFILHVCYCYKNFNEIIGIINLKISEIKKMAKQMLNFMGWSLIGNLSVVMRNQGSNIVLNIFFGLVTNAAFTISLTVMGAIGLLVSSVSNAINPQIFKKYAEGNLNEFIQLIECGTKYYMYFITIFVLPVIFYMDTILSFWLKHIPQGAISFCRLALILVLVDAYSNLLISGIQATGRIKWNQIFTGSLLLMVVPVSCLFFYMGYSENMVFYSAITFSFFSIFLRIYFLVKYVDYKFKRYLRKVFIPVILFQILVLTSSFLWFYVFGNGVFKFIFFMIVTLFINFLSLYFIFLTNSERNTIKSLKYKFF